MNYRSILLTCLFLLLSGCTEVKVWSFGGNTQAGRTGDPTDATEYNCGSGKRFFVRYMDNDATAWLIYPDREVSLNKASSSSGIRYTNGIAVLDINGNEASLKDGDKISYTGCKAGGKAK